MGFLDNSINSALPNINPFSIGTSDFRFQFAWASHT